MTSPRPSPRPLAGLMVVERSTTVAAAYAGRILATLGATTVLVEPVGGHPLRTRPPMLTEEMSSVFAYLGAGKSSLALDLTTDAGRAGLDELFTRCDVFIDDASPEDRRTVRLDPDDVMADHGRLSYVSVRPFGLLGPKSSWVGEELNLFHAAGEGALLPNGLAQERHPDRPPLQVAGSFAEMQAGLVAALGALASTVAGVGQLVDVSVQDAALAVGAFTVQRLGDGSVEHRSTRSFKYGGVLECRDGFVEMLTVEDRQWAALVSLLGSPEWAAAPELSDAAARGSQGQEINRRLRAWARDLSCDDLVARAQLLGVPAARFATALEVVQGVHERHRGLFQPVVVPGVGEVDVLTAPYQFDGAALQLAGGPPAAPQPERTDQRVEAS